MKLINADALIEKAKSEAEGMAEQYRDFGVLVEWLVDKLPSAQPEQKWIPVSRDLPEPRWKDVLVTREYKGADDGNKDKRYVEVVSMCGDEWVSYSDEYKMHPKNHKVIAWMPLPKPYGGEPG